MLETNHLYRLYRRAAVPEDAGASQGRLDGKGIAAKDNLNVDVQPFWSQVSLLDVASDGKQYNDVLWLDPGIWTWRSPNLIARCPAASRSRNLS
ncbi:hypothetical protein EsH8_II_000010 [Colletotrichum jinshuiense]